MDLQQELMQYISDSKRVSSGESIVAQHAQDFSHHPPHSPDVVAFPESEAEVASIVRFANDNRIPITPCGVLTSLEGHVIPVQGGISLDLTQMNRILEVRPRDFLVRVQPGVTRTQLNQELKRYGLQFPLDPGADATLGGMAATNASGTTAVRYGVMRNQVLDLAVVLADGSIIHTGGSAVKSSAGYNMTQLFIGSEGTLGVITELTLRIHPIPEATVAARAVFPDLDKASEAAYSMMSSGMQIGRIELVDEHTIHAVNLAKETSYTEQPTLFLEFHGSESSVQGDVVLGQELCEDEDCVDFVFETDTESRNQLWEARHDAALAVMQTAPDKKMKVTDVCVPLSELPKAIAVARQTIDSYGVYGAILGHVGDGNYHVIFMVDPNDKEEIRVADEINHQIVEYALERGGTCTGEHGVGIGKISYVEKEHKDTIPWMNRVKKMFDPNGILNPGKLLHK
ncbi:FAD-binding oxidoreductase [Alicyclobacillus sp. SO9]|uniref:FAD-binding oxidoreductase n=1 Tax=Alicyclobacillus sp. SO9 TaxID=2665646 RepID=UPI0018E8183D|nr:FAD-linked oxidase C-terminal domain-containing protein [Alicyclobacillus sp. SO9]QQE79345.1 FAD-binding protein [Alicyclobacillus sp. SO9]